MALGFEWEVAVGGRGILGLAATVAAFGLQVTAGAAPAGAEVVPPGCGFTLGASDYSEGLGSGYFGVQLVPLSPYELCTTTVTTVMSLVPVSGGRYDNVSDNPSTQRLKVTFSPKQALPELALQLGPHCADPAGPGVLSLQVDSLSVSTEIPGESCADFRSQNGSRLGVDDLTRPSLTGMAGRADGQGYEMTGSGGDLFTFAAGQSQPQAVITDGPDATSTAVAAAPQGDGYWVAGADGTVYSYDGARFYGPTTQLSLNAPVVGIAATPDGNGYWLVAADGGVFSFGDARFYGSTGNLHLNAPVVGMAATPDGDGYWLAASDGGVFSFGDAKFWGSAGNLRLNAPVVGIAAHQAGGYWLAASDGGVFTYGSAPYDGSAETLPLDHPISAIAPTADENGYWLLGEQGAVFSYGDARFFGSFG